MTKSIGLMTSGGDCGGLNAVLRAVTLRATRGYGFRVVGIFEGAEGLLTTPPRTVDLTSERVSGPVIRLGGTLLGTTNWGDPFAYPSPAGLRDRSGEVVAALRSLGLDGFIVVGGDGSLAIWRKLALASGVKLIGIPKTIDNDVALTEWAVGHPTAVEVATEALDRLQPTAASHSRVMILEVMGRDAGHIALMAGIAGGADAILVPEIPYRLRDLAACLGEIERSGRKAALIVVAEAVCTEAGTQLRQAHGSGASSYGGIGGYLARELAQLTGADTRITVLGHVQRGAAPVALDRIVASAFGVRAVDLIAAGKSDRMVAWRDRAVVDVDLADAVTGPALVSTHGTLVETARGLGIYLGDV